MAWGTIHVYITFVLLFYSWFSFHYIVADLLHNTAEFLDVLLDVDEELCEKWATPLLIQSMLEAFKQIG